ncbi:MAG: PLP-dependent aminotransferase family protein, partial [Hydrogenophaga sp.]|nr:PLP-dependent aminotransferase family protein [Hydrogenophaga sp.]
PDHVDDLALSQRLGQHGLIVRPLSAYCLHREDLRGLVMGYGYASPASIERYGPVVARAVEAAVGG